MSLKLAAAAFGVLALAVAAHAESGGVFAVNTNSLPGSFGATTAADNIPYGWLSPNGVLTNQWEIYRKRVGTSGTNPDLTLTNDITNLNQALVSNEVFGNNYVTDPGCTIAITKSTTSVIGGQTLAAQVFNNAMNMEFRIGFMQAGAVGTGWLNNAYGDNNVSHNSGGWTYGEDIGNADNGANMMFLQIQFDKNGVATTDTAGYGGIYTHSGSDLANGQGNLDITGSGSGTVGTGLQPITWSISDNGNGTANFNFSFGGYSFTKTNISLTTDSHSIAFNGGAFDLTNVVPIIYIGGQGSWGLAGGGTGGAIGFVQVVPEPATLGLLGLGALALIRRRK